MATLKVARPMLEMAQTGRTIATCSFFSTSRRMRKAGIGMAPKVRKTVRSGVSSFSETEPGKSTENENVEFSFASCEPKMKDTIIAIFQSAFKSGVIPIEGRKQFEFVSLYQGQDKRNSTLLERTRLCKEFHLSTSNLYHLAQIIGTRTTQKLLAQKIMNFTADLGEPLAACELVEAAIRQKSVASPNFSRNLQRLQKMASADSTSGHQAKASLGKYFMSQQKYKDAMEMLTAATDGALDGKIASESFLNMGKIYLIWKDEDAALKFFKKSAGAEDSNPEDNNPEAFYYLAATINDGSDEQRKAYHIAAAYGIDEACHNLGNIELEKVDSRPEKPRSMLDYGMAREWFQVAATNDFIPSMLNMALICKSVGEKESGMAWLNRAEKWMEKKQSPRMAILAQNARKNWSNETIHITAINSGYCGKLDPFEKLRKSRLRA